MMLGPASVLKSEAPLPLVYIADVPPPYAETGIFFGLVALVVIGLVVLVRWLQRRRAKKGPE